MQIRDVRVLVFEALMLVGMRMRFGSFIPMMFVAVVFVMHVPVFVPRRLVDVSVGMLYPDEEPRTGNHEEGAGCGPEAGNLAEKRPGERDRHAGRGCEQGRGPGRAQMPEGDDEEHDRKAVGSGTFPARDQTPGISSQNSSGMSWASLRAPLAPA